MKRNNDCLNNKYKVNDEIKYDGNVLLVENKEIGVDGGIVNIDKARDIANNLGLDLFEVSYNNNMPILKIGNFEKIMYQLKKNAKKNSHTSKPMKEIQLSVTIADNDLQTKAKHAREFLKNGSKVKVILTMRGREKSRREENKKSIYQFITMLDDVSIPESMPKDEGPSKTIVILKSK